MKKTKVIVMGFLISICFSVPGWASTIPKPPIEKHLTQQIDTRAEVRKWYYRKNNGIKEKRLWSVTYGYWITDWMPV